MRALGARDAGRLRVALSTVFLAALLAPAGAHASMFAGEMLDKVADYLALFVLFLVPIGGVVLFWLVHILPEKVAEKRFHRRRTRSRRCACSRSCSAACSGRWPGCGRTPSR